MKKRRIVACAVAAVLMLSMTACRTANKVKDKVEEGADKVEDKVENSVTPPADKAKINVTLTVEAKDIIGSEYESKFEKDMLAEEGTILSRTNYVVEDGTNVSQLLSKAMDENKIPYTMKGADTTAEISGIRGITGGMAGENSIWTFMINGKEETGSMYSYKLRDGDDVKVYYRVNVATQGSQVPAKDGTTEIPKSK